MATTGARLLITGASGAGATTLGAALAGRLAVPHADTDDYFWVPTDPPFTQARPGPERARLLQEIVLPLPAWVLSGDLLGWPDEVIARVTHVVFLRVPTGTRLARLDARQRTRYGEAIAPGGALRPAHEAFLTWAAAYDDGTQTGRSLPAHLEWLAAVDQPALTLPGTTPTAELADAVIAWIGALEDTT